MFESAQQQIGDKGADDLHGQGILAVAERALDLEHLLDPLPPVLNGPSLFIQLRDTERAQVEAIGQDPDQLPIGQLVADQPQEDAFPAWQTDAPVTGQTKARRGGGVWHRKALQDAVAEPVFEAHHEVRSGLEQGAQKGKAEVPAIKDVGPVPGPLPGRRAFQIVYFTGRDHPLVGDPTGPLQDRMHLGRPAPLTVLGPAVRQQRQLDQTRIDYRNAGELPAHPLKPRPVRLYHRHPGLDHLSNVPLGNAIGQGIEGHRPAQCLLQTGVFGEGPDPPPQFHRVNQLIDHQHFDQARARQRTPARFIGITIKDRLQVKPVQGSEQQGDDCDRLRHANPPSGFIRHVSLPDVGRFA